MDKNIIWIMKLVFLKIYRFIRKRKKSYSVKKAKCQRYFNLRFKNNKKIK